MRFLSKMVCAKMCDLIEKALVEKNLVPYPFLYDRSFGPLDLVKMPRGIFTRSMGVGSRSTRQEVLANPIFDKHLLSKERLLYIKTLSPCTYPFRQVSHRLLLCVLCASCFSSVLKKTYVIKCKLFLLIYIAILYLNPIKDISYFKNGWTFTTK